MNLSFAGCGFLGLYHAGVAACFKTHAPHLPLKCISGASAGAIAACSLLCDLPVSKMVSDTLHLMQEARKSSLGPFRPSFQIQDLLWKQLSENLPEDAHLRVSGKLRISLTRVRDGKNVILSHFDSKEDLLQALLASCFIPVFSGVLPPKYHGERYMDGGFSDNLPRLDENTITVSPFCGETDICPRDKAPHLFHLNVANTSIAFSTNNIFRFAQILYPPKPEVLSDLCQQGFEDALRFLQQSGLIYCSKCVSVQSSFLISSDQCQECYEQRYEATVAMLPDILVTIFQEYIDSANRGLYNWLLSHRSMKIISLLSLPYVIPLEIALELSRKLSTIIRNKCISQTRTVKFLIIQTVLEVLKSASSRTACNLFPTLTASDVNINFTPSDEQHRVIPPSQPDLHGDDTFENLLRMMTYHETLSTDYFRDEFKFKEEGKFSVQKEQRVEDKPVDDITESSSEEDDNEESVRVGSDPESEWMMRKSNDVREREETKILHRIANSQFR